MQPALNCYYVVLLYKWWRINPVALKLAQILYGAQVGIYVKKDALGTVQTKFLRSIVATPNGTENPN